MFIENINQVEIIKSKCKYFKYLCKFKKFTEQVCTHLKITKDILIIPSDGSRMRRLTIKHLKKDGFSTVLTFNYDEWSEIYISIYNISCKHKIKKQNLLEETQRYIIHCLINTIENINDDKENLYWNTLKEYKLI